MTFSSSLKFGKIVLVNLSDFNYYFWSDFTVQFGDALYKQQLPTCCMRKIMVEIILEQDSPTLDENHKIGFR